MEFSVRILFLTIFIDVSPEPPTFRSLGGSFVTTAPQKSRCYPEQIRYFVIARDALTNAASASEGGLGESFVERRYFRVNSLR